jgi:hypothetical protein
VQLRQGQLLPALQSCASAAFTSRRGGSTHLDALLLCAHIADAVATARLPVPHGLFGGLAVAPSDAVSPLHWLSHAVKFHGASREAILRFGASLAHVGQAEVAAMWLGKVRVVEMCLSAGHGGRVCRGYRGVRIDFVRATYALAGVVICLSVSLPTMLTVPLCCLLTGTGPSPITCRRHPCGCTALAAPPAPVRLCVGACRTQ